MPEAPNHQRRLIIVERTAAVTTLIAIAALAYAVILLLAFSVIIVRERTIDTLRHQLDNESETVLCRAKFNIEILLHDQTAEAAERDLLTSLIRELSHPIEERDFTAVLDDADRVDVLNAETQAHIKALQSYLQAGQPLPCPIDDQGD